MTTIPDTETKPPQVTQNRSLLRLAGGILAAAIAMALYTQLARIAELVTYSVLGLARGSHLGSAVEFFLYEMPKVLLLLVGGFLFNAVL